MIPEIFETERLMFKPFRDLSEEQKKLIGKSWANPFNARYNSMRDPYGAVNDLASRPEPTFTDLEEYYDYMCYRVAFSKQTGEVVGTCRFGKYHASETLDVWDFGFNVLLNHWGKGYGVEILSAILEQSKKAGAKQMVGGADIENYGSYKAMVRNGFEFVGYDEYGDYAYLLDLQKAPRTKEQIDLEWQKHIERSKKDFGEDKFNRLELINSKIAEMVKRIQNGEDEDILVKEYFEKLNNIEKFKEVN